MTATGRLSSNNPNLQNIPVRTDLGAEIRGCFVAEEGHRLVVADYSQIELRLMALLSQEPALLEAYHTGEDVHRVTAAAVAGIPVEEVTKRQREHAKATNFGIMYGLSAYGLSEQVEIPVDEAQAFIDAYFVKYPRVKEFRERVIAQASQDGYVTTLFGRRRAVPELRSSNFRLRSLGERLAVNTSCRARPPTSSRSRWCAVSRELERRSWRSRLVLQVHDELVLECPRGRGRGGGDPAARRHVRRLRDGPAARGRGRRRRRLGRGQVLAWVAAKSKGARRRRSVARCSRRTGAAASRATPRAILQRFRPAAVPRAFPICKRRTAK